MALVATVFKNSHMATPGAHIRAGVARSRLGAEVPKLHQNVGTCTGLVGQLLSQN